MKKKISYLFMVALIACSLIMPCVADEPTTELVTEITTELVTEALEETEAPVEEVTTPEVTEPAETEPKAPAETAPVEEVDEWEVFKAKITDSATWTMIGTGIVTILTILGTVKSKFDKISSLVHNKADNDTIKGELAGLQDELKKAYNANHKEVTAVMERYEEALKTTADNEQKLYAILTLFMTNCKISESAKAEILNILADVKKYSGNVQEFVAQAQETIDKDIAEKEKDTPPTPNLDQLLEEDYMDLG